MRLSAVILALSVLTLAFTACQKDKPENKPPVVSTGADITTTLAKSTDSVRLTGSATDPDGNVAGYQWTLVSGPSTPTIGTPGSPNTYVKDFVSGTYVFQLAATDDKGATGIKTIQVKVTVLTVVGINRPPLVNAGTDQTITLTYASDSIRLLGSATDLDGTVVGYLWSQVSGPNASTLTSPGSPGTYVKGLATGTYVFQLMATDDKGATGVDTVTIRVNVPQVQNSTLQPASNPYEVFAYSYDPTHAQTGDSEIPIGSWTVNGTPVNYRAYMKFDYAIPSNATIISAKLSLYSMPNPHGGNNIDAQYGSANAFYIQRVTSAWTSTTTTWNNQPSTTSTNQITIPNSTSSTQDALNIDVTQLVKDMQQSGNYGFSMRLVTENPLNIRQYASSYYSDATKRPKLEIQYSN